MAVQGPGKPWGWVVVDLGVGVAHTSESAREPPPTTDRPVLLPPPPLCLLFTPLPLSFQLRKLQLFTLQQHVNTLGPTPSGKLWAVLHNLGSSDLVQVSWVGGRVGAGLSVE